MRLSVLSLFGSCFIALVSAALSHKVFVVDEWKNLQFGFDSEAQKEYAVVHGLYDPIGQKRPYDTDVEFKLLGIKRKFLSMPRVVSGLPFTLAVVSDRESTDKGPLIRAYPSMEWHLNRTCDGLLAVFRIYIEQNCNRLWVIDSGRDFTASPVTQVCPPKIVAFNLRTDEMEFKFEIPSDQFTPEVSIFNSISVLSKGSCESSIAYATDARGPGVVVFRLEDFTSWRTSSEHYRADPQYYETTIANETFNFIDGIYTVAPSLRSDKLYFHPFASVSEIVVPLHDINNPSLWTGNAQHEDLFEVIGERPTQSSTEAFDSRGNLWFTLLEPLSIVCWNPVNPYDVEHFRFVTIDEENLQFVAGLKIRRHPIFGDILWGTSNRLQKHNTGTVNPNEINYRIFLMPIAGIDCKHPNHFEY